MWWLYYLKVWEKSAVVTKYGWTSLPKAWIKKSDSKLKITSNTFGKCLLTVPQNDGEKYHFDFSHYDQLCVKI